MFLICEKTKPGQSNSQKAIINMDIVSHIKKDGNKVLVFYKDGKKEIFDKVIISKKADLSNFQLI